MTDKLTYEMKSRLKNLRDAYSLFDDFTKTIKIGQFKQLAKEIEDIHTSSKVIKQVSDFADLSNH